MDPPVKQLLLTLGLDNLIQLGMVWYNQEDAEFATMEHGELQNR